jgi:voltage-gated potassium channel Kch
MIARAPETATAASARVRSGTQYRLDVQHRYGLLLISTILLVAVEGISSPGPLQHVVVTALAAGCVQLAVRATDPGPRVTYLTAAFGIVVLLLAVIRALGGHGADGASLVTTALLVAIAPPAVAVGVLRDLRSTGQVRLAAVMGVLAFYMLLGMVFAFSYGAINDLGSEPVFAGGVATDASACLYFSFTTLTTVGFGDIVAGTNLGRTVAVFEALLGQIYLVTVVSLIVSNLGRPARRARAGGRLAS